MKYNIKNILLYLICFVVVAIIVMFVVMETEQNQIDNNRSTIFYSGEEESITVIGQYEEESTEDFFYGIETIDVTLELGDKETTEEVTTYENWDIESLAKRYFEAVRTCNVNEIKSIVDTNEEISEEVLSEKAQYIENYINFTYYLKSGLVDRTYILYVIYEVQFKEIEETAPAVERFYIKENSDGVVYISRIPLEGMYAVYLQEIEKKEEVIQLKESVKERYNRACYAEEKLIELENIMNESIWKSE